MTATVNAIFYTRVSTPGQARCQDPTLTEAYSSLDVQESIVRNAMNGKCRLLGVVKAVGRASLVKPEKNLLSLIENNRDVCVVVFDVSRLCRNLTQFEVLLTKATSKNIWFYSVRQNVSTNSPEGLDQFRRLVKEAQAESEALGARARARIASVRLAGGHIGPAPYGYRKVRGTDNLFRLEENPEELSMIDTIKKMVNEPTSPSASLHRAITLMRTPGSFISEITDCLHSAGGNRRESFHLIIKDGSSKRGKEMGKIPTGYGTLHYSHIARELNRFNLKYKGEDWTTRTVVQFYKRAYWESLVSFLNQPGTACLRRGKPWTVTQVKKLIEVPSSFQFDKMKNELSSISYVEPDSDFEPDESSDSEEMEVEVPTVPSALPRRTPRRPLPTPTATPSGPLPELVPVYYTVGSYLPPGVPAPPSSGWVYIPRSMM